MSYARQAFAGLPIVQIVEIQMYYPECLAQEKGARRRRLLCALCSALRARASPLSAPAISRLLSSPPPRPRGLLVCFVCPRSSPGAHAPNLC